MMCSPLDNFLSERNKRTNSEVKSAMFWITDILISFVL